MATLTINGKEYDLDVVSEKARAQVNSIQFIDSELQRLGAQQAVLNTARNAYLKDLLEELDSKDTKKTKRPRKTT